MLWDQERDDKLRDLLAKGLSSSQVAERIGGITRNAVIGRAHRLGISSRCAQSRKGVHVSPHQIKYKKVRVPRPKLPEERKPVTRAAVVESLHKAPTPLPAMDDMPPLVAFADLEAHHCRWIPGEHKDGCCGRQKVPGLPYCETHARRAYEARPISKRPTNYAPRVPGAVYAKIKRDHNFLEAVAQFVEP